MESKLYKVSYDLCLNLLDISDIISKQNKFYLSNQLSKSCTSICANISEANNAESKKDFIHKLKIAAKEAEETRFWLNLIADKKYTVVNKEHFESLLYIQKMLSKSISTSTKNLNQKPK